MWNSMQNNLKKRNILQFAEKLNLQNSGETRNDEGATEKIP